MNERSQSPAGKRFRVLCPHCGVRFSAPSSLVGRRVTCLKCAQPFTVPRRHSPPSKTTEDRTRRRAGRYLAYALVGLAGVIVGASVGFVAAWLLLQANNLDAQQLLARLQELEHDQQGSQQRYEGSLRDLRSSNIRLSRQLKDAESQAEQERTKGEDLLQRLQSAHQNFDLDRLLDQDVAQAAETVLGLLSDLSTSPRTDYRNLRWQVRSQTTTRPFRIDEATWRLAWRLPGANDRITIEVYRNEPRPSGQEKLVDTISGQASGARRIQAAPGIFYLHITASSPVEVIIEAADA